MWTPLVVTVDGRDHRCNFDANNTIGAMLDVLCEKIPQDYTRFSLVAIIDDKRGENPQLLSNYLPVRRKVVAYHVTSDAAEVHISFHRSVDSLVIRRKLFNAYPRSFVYFRSPNTLPFG